MINKTTSTELVPVGNNKLQSVSRLMSVTSNILNSSKQLDKSNIEWWNTLPDIWKKIFNAHLRAMKSNNNKITGDLKIYKIPRISELELLTTPSTCDLLRIVSIEHLEVRNNTNIILNKPNALVTDLIALKKLDRLKTLYIFSDNIIDVTSLIHFHCLEFLYLGISSLKDLSPVSKLVNLEELVINDTEVEDILCLNNLIKLRRLWFSNTNVKDITVLSSLTNLVLLSMSNTKVRNLEPIKLLVNLRELHIKGLELNDLNVLSNLKNLERLSNDNN